MPSPWQLGAFAESTRRRSCPARRRAFRPHRSPTRPHHRRQQQGQRAEGRPRRGVDSISAATAMTALWEKGETIGLFGEGDDDQLSGGDGDDTSDGGENNDVAQRRQQRQLANRRLFSNDVINGGDGDDVAFTNLSTDGADIVRSRCRVRCGDRRRPPTPLRSGSPSPAPKSAMAAPTIPWYQANQDGGLAVGMRPENSSGDGGRRPAAMMTKASPSWPTKASPSTCATSFQARSAGRPFRGRHARDGRRRQSHRDPGRPALLLQRRHGQRHLHPAAPAWTSWSAAGGNDALNGGAGDNSYDIGGGGNDTIVDDLGGNDTAILQHRDRPHRQRKDVGDGSVLWSAPRSA